MMNSASRAEKTTRRVSLALCVHNCDQQSIIPRPDHFKCVQVRRRYIATIKPSTQASDYDTTFFELSFASIYFIIILANNAARLGHGKRDERDSSFLN